MVVHSNVVIAATTADSPAKTFSILSPNVLEDDDYITAVHEYNTVAVTSNQHTESELINYTATPIKTQYVFKTLKHVPSTGLMIVGLGGNNGTTVAAGIIAHRNKFSWTDKRGTHMPDWYGSLTQSTTVKLGYDYNKKKDVYVPVNRLVPMVDPKNIIVGGWDISSDDLGRAMEKAEVLDYDLQKQVKNNLQSIKPFPGIYIKDFIAPNQEARANNILQGTLSEMVLQVREDIRTFKKTNKLDKVIIIWSGTTERYVDEKKGVHDTADNLIAAIENNCDEISPSILYCVASIQEGCSYINGSPQNTFVPGIIELAESHKVFLGGDDFKSGQTKLKSVLVDFLVSSGIKPVGIASYNHLGNNDGYNLSNPQQFRSKEISKTNVVTDIIESNNVLFKEGEAPDHVIVIKYLKCVGDTKKALDEYSSKIFLNGENTISIHNACEDSLLAAPLLIDFVVLTELCQRISISSNNGVSFEKMRCVLSILSFLAKQPLVSDGEPVVNSLFKQRECIVNILRACAGLPPDNHMLLEHKVQT